MRHDNDVSFGETPAESAESLDHLVRAQQK
jgi:hypothetical protein